MASKTKNRPIKNNRSSAPTRASSPARASRAASSNAPPANGDSNRGLAAGLPHWNGLKPTAPRSRPDLARDRITGYLANLGARGAYDQDAYLLLGEIYSEMRDYARAGAACCFDVSATTR